MSTKKMIGVDDIAIDTTQSRRGSWEGDELDERLVDSIKGIGLIHDIIVRPTTTDKYGGETEKPYAIVAGSRRLKAMIQAGKYNVPCKVLELSDIEAIAMSFSENIGRKNLTEYEKMITIITWMELLKKTGKKEKEATKEIASIIFGGNESRLYGILQTAGLPKQLQILIKEPKDRTEEEKHILEEHNISPEFKMNFMTLSVLKSISDQLELPSLKKTETIFSMLSDEDLGLQKETWLKQYEILSDIRDKLREGKAFTIVMNELKEDMKIFTIPRVKAVRIKIPDEYDLWHNRACSRAGLTGEDLVRRVYLDWLEREAKRSGW